MRSVLHLWQPGICSDFFTGMDAVGYNFDDFYGRGIPGPASAALTPKVLEKEYYEYGISLSTTLSSMVELIGTAVAAVIIAVIGTSGAIYVDMATFFSVRTDHCICEYKRAGLVKQKFDRKAYVKNLADGFSYVKKRCNDPHFFTFGSFPECNFSSIE